MDIPQNTEPALQPEPDDNMAISINTMPQEILEMILGNLTNECETRDTQSVLSSSLVCHHWYNVAAPILWTDLVITNKTVTTFTAAIALAPTHLVHCMTLQMATVRNDIFHHPVCGPHINRFASTSDVTWQAYENLSLALPQMSRLNSFSLIVQLDHSARYSHALKYVALEAIQSLLSRLPDSVEDLELDTQGFDISRGSRTHLCPILHKLLQRLKNVKLHISMLCPMLFPAPANPCANDKLGSAIRGAQNLCETVPTNLETLVIETGIDRQPFAQLPTICSPTAASSVDLEVALNALDERLFLAAQAALKANCFPKIQRFSIFSEYYNYADDAPCYAIVERDFITGRSHSSPLLHHHSGIIVRYKDRCGLEKEAFSSEIQTATRQLAGPVWVESLSGSRHHWHFPSTRKAVSSNYQWKHLEDWIWEGEDISSHFDLERYTELTSVLRLERKAGRRLVKACATDGVIDVKPELRESCEDEDGDDDDDGESEDWEEADYGIDTFDYETYVLPDF